MTTLVIGASTNPDRYSYKAIHALLLHHHNVLAIGNKVGVVQNIEIQKNFDNIDCAIDTVTLYINANLQAQYFEKIIALQPRRVIFNPGTENEIFSTMLKANNITALEACTLVMLSIGNY
jgi:uncharacterized protein